MRVDLHCHSKYSKRPTLWIMQKIGCPESFTEPAELHAICREKGMDAVTITDHNVIDACLELGDLGIPHIMGCEYTTYFPEDRCKVHVLAYDFSERQHEEITKARENIFDLVEYFRVNHIKHVCAHPLFGPNSKLTVEHVEQLALLFKNWEWNGDQQPFMNEVLRRIMDDMTPEDIERLSNKHGFKPHFAEPWKKNVTAGSDDHSSLHLASTYTEVPGATTFEEFWAGVERNATQIHCDPSGPRRFARNIYGIAYQFYKSKFSMDRYVSKDLFLRFVDKSLQIKPQNKVNSSLYSRFNTFIANYRKAKPPSAASNSVFSLARFEAEKLIRSDESLMALVNTDKHDVSDWDKTWFEFVNEISDNLTMHIGEHVIDRVRKASLFDLFHSAGSAGALYALLGPYFASFGHHAQERRFSMECLKHFTANKPSAGKHEPPARVAHFTDTYRDVNGVARTLQQQLKSAKELGRDYTMVTCFADKRPDEEGVLAFEAIGTFGIPEYPELNLPMPSFLRVLNRCYDEGFTHIHIATPGPVGLIGLGIARILGLPVTGTYHTALPQYGKILTDDAYVEDVLWKAMIWFYDMMDAIHVPSKATGDELIERGVTARKIVVYPRGVDVDKFHPDNRRNFLEERFGLGGDMMNLLYVGRVSKEKNLDQLSEAYRSLLERGLQARLIVTGDGPYRDEMQRTLEGTPAFFTGYLDGADLTTIYASCDALVFPSTTDTFGNVVLEAEASGIPVIVSDRGGPHENVIPEQTGIIVRANDVEELTEAMAAMVSDPERTRCMGAAAREYAAQRGFTPAFAALWEIYLSNTPEDANALGHADLGRLLERAAMESVEAEFVTK